MQPTPAPLPTRPAPRRVPAAAALLLAAGLLAFGGLHARAQQGAATVIIPRKTDPNQLISFSFQQASVDDILRFLADATGKIVYKDPAVTGTFTIRNQSRITIAEALEHVGFIFSLRGYSLVENERALIVTTQQEGRTRRSGKFSQGKDLSVIPRGSEIITHLFPLNTVDAAILRQELTPLFPANTGIIIANADTNSLLVIDEADNVRRIGEIILRLDRDLADEITVEVIRLRFADATEVSNYLSDLFRPEPVQQGAPAGVPPGIQIPGQPGQPGQPGGAQPAAQRGALSQLRGRVRFAADQRSNSLLVYASPANIRSIKQLVDQIDVNLAPRTEYRIVALQYADATALAEQINLLLDGGATSRPTGGGGFGPFGGFGGFGGAFGGNQGNRAAAADEFAVVPDVRTNSLIITGPIDSVGGLEDLVRKLDTPSQVTSVVRTFQLKNAIASEVANTLRSLFQGVQQQGGGVGFGLFGAGGARGQIPPNSPLDLLRQVTIVANDQTNQLLISGPAQTFPVIETLLKEEEGGLDRRLPQVFIEVIIADVTLDDTMKWGVEWTAVSGRNALGTDFGLTSPTADNSGFRYSILSKNFQATLRALRDTNKLRIVSTPHVMVTDNSPALISIGEQIPYAGETTITNGVAQSSVQFQDVAITLNVTPHISPGRHILMDIDQVVNSLIEFVEVSPGQRAPRTTSRRAGTTVIVQNDQTVVLGGIISNNDQKRVNKVPILGDIPLLGQLFRNTTRTKGRTELVVFLTPHIVAEPEDADKLRDYERQRLQVDPIRNLEAPFTRPPDITPDDVRRRRR